MGCFQSKKESSDLHPNVFRVVNIDENGADLCTGQLEITESDIILYREGRESTVWPLHSLRRYGFEGEIFSFESGRRCETGEGIYAFRCRRASILFQALQQQIQLRNVVHDSVQYPVSRLSPSPQGRQTLQASVIHRSSIDNGQPENLAQSFNNNLPTAVTPGVPTTLPTLTQSPRSPSSADILEVMPLYPHPQASGNHVTNVYQVRDFKREHNNNQAEMAADHRHVYSNDFNRDLAMLRNTLRQETALNTIRDIEDENHFLENRYVGEKAKNNSDKSLLSPTMSNSSEHYAQLSIEQQEPSRLYVNIAPNDNNTFDPNKNEVVPTTPLTPKQVEYCNLTVGTKAEINTYANLMLGDIITDSVQNSKQIINNLDRNQKFSESDTFASMSPVEDLNYAILDIDSNKDNIKTVRDMASPESQSYNSSKNESTTSYSSQPRGRVVSQSSIDRSSAANTANPAPSASIGYTTIDFDKTVALTSVAAGAELCNLDGSRKNRHNSCSVINIADQGRT
ncbi:fibroblast growth factor receptor substrate 2 [Pararge aegeria]|uniref:Jg21217 protein n=1 Tax=Pararge aegeria aegeria TaxID=348720 RepID=A0A8S4REZ2_9NEOP|nr:fibroblast growth factor receptor substrate 2 [Pararge aegeria]XP_039751679.1 fibroblast growth factor receptor substrate 2 [Pararge aegeria]CAH2234414.1 jg21217 [Pararge aegeria aegeria]